ncbi:MAG: GNAT family N-acetyltransferase [Advenella sp.]|uniref:GNAT family N-acetyltransferase n=1 Tax=Advenella kashmirensis TaxID=310575 RepID=A0A356LN76_9BURK|nr:GNAT family N-acetyltransferase [Advenella kashmirensis]
MLPFEIAILNADDAAAFRRFRLAALQSAPQDFGSSHAAESAQPLAFFRDRLRTSKVWAARKDGAIVGTAGLAPWLGVREQHKGFVWGVFVASHVRGQGIAQALLTRLLAYADQHYEQVTLSATAANTPALKLYQEAGFEIYGKEPRSLKDETGYSDELLMVRFAGKSPV